MIGEALVFHPTAMNEPITIELAIPSTVAAGLVFIIGHFKRPSFQ
jgi:hypothetical protein